MALKKRNIALKKQPLLHDENGNNGYFFTHFLGSFLVFRGVIRIFLLFQPFTKLDAQFRLLELIPGIRNLLYKPGFNPPVRYLSVAFSIQIQPLLLFTHIRIGKLHTQTEEGSLVGTYSS